MKGTLGRNLKAGTQFHIVKPLHMRGFILRSSSPGGQFTPTLVVGICESYVKTQERPLWPGRKARAWKWVPEVRMGSGELRNQESNHDVARRAYTLSPVLLSQFS